MRTGTGKVFNVMGKSQKALEEPANFCIEMALKGRAIDPKGSNMADIVDIKSFSETAASKKKKQ